MLKKTCFIIGLMLLSGCTREVYLQSVPCADCEPEPCAACTELTPECCPELAMHREIQVYEVYEDVTPACPSANKNCSCANTEKHRNCRIVCRQKMIKE